MTPPSWLEHVTSVAERGRAMLGRGSTGTNSTANLAATCHRLIARRGEASGLALATDVVRALERMSTPSRRSSWRCSPARSRRRLTRSLRRLLAGERSPPMTP